MKTQHNTLPTFEETLQDARVPALSEDSSEEYVSASGPYSKQAREERDLQHLPPIRCEAFLRCTNIATTAIENAILGIVPCCERCKERLS